MRGEGNRREEGERGGVINYPQLNIYTDGLFLQFCRRDMNDQALVFLVEMCFLKCQCCTHGLQVKKNNYYSSTIFFLSSKMT